MSKSDFTHYYIATQLFLSGENPYVNVAPLYGKYNFELGSIQEVVSPYPPVFFALMAPFAILEPSTAFAGWVIFQFICLIYVLFLIKYLFRELTPVKWLFLSLLIMSSSFVYYHFHDSQIALFLVALVLSAYALIDTKYRHAANYLVCLAGLIKIYPFIFLPWFIWQKFQNKKRISCYDLLGIAAFIILIITVTGWQSWFAFIDRSLHGSVGESFGIYYNYSLPSFIINYIYIFLGYFPSGVMGAVIVYGGVLTGFGVLLFSYIFCWRYLKSKSVGFAFITISMLLTFPRVLGHYHVFLIFPVALAFVQFMTAPGKPMSHYMWGFFVYILLNLHNLHNILMPYFWIRPASSVILFLNYVPFFGLVTLYTYFLGNHSSN